MKEARIVKISLPDQSGPLVAALSHAPDLGDTHGEKEKTFGPLRVTLNDPLGCEDTLIDTCFPGQGLEKVVGEKLITAIRRSRFRGVIEAFDPVPLGADPNHKL